MKTKKRFFVDCHQDIAYSIRANKRFFDSKDKNYMITLDETLNSGLSLIFSTIFVSHVKKDKRFQEATLQFKEYERIFKEHAYFYKVETEELPEPSDNIIYRSDYMTSDDGVTYKLKWVFYKPEGILTMTEAETLKATEYNEGKE